MLEGRHHVWEGKEGVLVEEQIEQEDDDDRYPYECEGYLVEQGLAFVSFVELLAYAYEHRRMNWEHLWSEDWLDRIA